MASFSSTSFHFFSIILQKTLQYNKLQIPKKIVRQCGKGLRDHVVLKLPCESQWNLGLSKSEDGIMWIDKGWTEFAKHYSIERGYLLVFRYQGNSQFHVIIFDNTTNEIDYPIRIETKHKDNSVEIHDIPFSRPCPKTRERSPLPSPQSHKRTRNAQTQPHCDLIGQSASKHKCSVKENSMETLSPVERAQALNRGHGFESSHPFFMIAIQPTHVNYKCTLCVPRSFALSHLGTDTEIICLKASDERTWSVKYVFKSKPKFMYGWNQFVQDNHIRRGDLCVFVMTKSVDSFLFEVSILRDDNETVQAGGSKLGEAKASHFQYENPHFKVVMMAYNTSKKSRCHIPVEFGRSYLKRNEDWLRLITSDGRSLSVQYRMRTTSNRLGRFELCRGWFMFVQENGLEIGDICTFELTNWVEICFKVHIVKSVVKAQKQMPPGNIREVKSVFANQDGQIIKASNAADKFCSNNPYFRVDFRSSHFEINSLSIPISFARSNLKEETQIVTLQVGDKVWQVNLIYNPPSKYRFSLGWSVFLSRNSIHPGDVCVFELIDRNQAVIKVSVFRKT